MAAPDVPETESIRGSRRPETLWSRRDFFSLAGWAGVLVVLATMVLGFFRFMFPRVLFEPPTRFKAGRPQEYLVGTVDEHFKIERRVWLVREGYGLFALLAICTHLGCTPNWFPAEDKFKCPCHGSGFRRDGTNFEGPAPRPLDRIKVELTPEGELVVDKGHIFRMVAGKDPDEQYPQAILKV